MNSLIQQLCDDFEVDTATGVVLPKSRTTMDRTAVATGPKPTGCCCLAVLTDAPTAWTIEVTQVVEAHTRPGSHQVILNPASTPVEFGAFTGAGSVAFQGAVPTAGHELCGHAALGELGAHPAGQDRLVTDVHDPTVRIENLVSTEQGVPAGELRGLAAAGPHRGESVDKITVGPFPFNGTAASSLPAAERDKIRFGADYATLNERWVDVLGHSDAVGSSGAKLAVSQARADAIRGELITDGVPPTITKFGFTGVTRFTRVEGLSDTKPPSPALDANPENWRRVEILFAGFPAGAQVPPAGTPTTVTPHVQQAAVPALKGSRDPCVSHLVGGAYP
jgi:outer membrane protein OmpA-like peptidoglycan-associated protein